MRSSAHFPQCHPDVVSTQFQSHLPSRCNNLLLNAFRYLCPLGLLGRCCDHSVCRLQMFSLFVPAPVMESQRLFRKPTCTHFVRGDACQGAVARTSMGKQEFADFFFFCTALWMSVTVKSPPPPPQLDRTFTSVPPLPGAQLKAKMNVGHTGSWGAETVGALLMCSFTVGQSFSTSEG